MCVLFMRGTRYKLTGTGLDSQHTWILKSPGIKSCHNSQLIHPQTLFDFMWMGYQDIRYGHVWSRDKCQTSKVENCWHWKLDLNTFTRPLPAVGEQTARRTKLPEWSDSPVPGLVNEPTLIRAKQSYPRGQLEKCGSVDEDSSFMPWEWKHHWGEEHVGLCLKSASETNWGAQTPPHPQTCLRCFGKALMSHRRGGFQMFS